MRWTSNKTEDDGATNGSEPSLRRLADAVMVLALDSLRRAFLEGDGLRQWRAQLLLEMARGLRSEVRRAAKLNSTAAERRQLQGALRALEQLAHSRAPVPVA